jgi:hypothetical protein
LLRSSLGPKALGLCVVLVGMLAFAGAAQAEPGAFWLVNGAKISESLLPTVEAETDVKGTLLTTLGGQSVDISCETILLVGAHLLEPQGKFLGKIVFHGCDFLSLKEGVATLQKACEPFVGVNKGLIETKSVTGLIESREVKLGTKESIVEVIPTEGTLFATVNLGSECSFGSALEIGGVLFLENAEGKFSIDTVKHLLTESLALTALTVNGKVGAAVIDGSVWGFLGAAHKGLTFSGQPGSGESGSTKFWLVNGSKFTAGLKPSLQAETDTEGTLLTTLNGTPIDIKCKKLELIGAHLVEPTAQFTGKVLYHECDFLSLVGGVATLQKACEPFVGANKGLIETNSITGSIALHEGVGVLEVKPTEGSLFATINLGEECGFGSALKVGDGENKSTKKVLPSALFLKDTKGRFSTDEVKHLVEELAALTTLYVNGGETKATIDGSAWTFLSGAHQGLAFSGQPALGESGSTKFWLVNGSKFTAGLKPSLQAETDTEGTLLTTLGGKSVDIKCKKLELSSARLIEPTAQFTGKVIYQECDFLSLKEGKATLQKACEPFVGANKGLIETNSITGSIALHEGAGVLEVKPTEGSLFTTMDLGEECAFGEQLKVGDGENKTTKKVLPAVLFLKDAAGKFSIAEVKHLVEELAALTTLYINKGETKATIDGSAWTFLSGIYQNLTFSGQPE